MTLLVTTVATPFGDMSLIGSQTCLHVASFSADLDQLRDRLSPDLRDQAVRRGEMPAAVALRRYLAGDVGALDEVQVSQPGGPFHSRVWAVMRSVAPGTTVSYGELAARAGAPRAVRAAASACARNAICLFIPCHRIVRGDGTLGGYYYGLDIKLRLLEHESCRSTAAGGAQQAVCA
ncbi:MAG: methylated-DNA--[protein]-cysteine S-methyltransferase [Candidatus Dormibacteraeota bacterium]|uniref:methylated-DNA--[protein]-cysteine S-methyltransferase n=1 Tax=Candidatus Amunia macphersoniae TaxID=3127014 RepID=A0A934KMI4_9BACT|nr:methylated-DNA--[protein]-cysteine S-methyltransferase [Candidatus Dormibacteraeota bacterium]